MPERPAHPPCAEHEPELVPTAVAVTVRDASAGCWSQHPSLTPLNVGQQSPSRPAHATCDEQDEVGLANEVEIAIGIARRLASRRRSLRSAEARKGE